LIVVAVERLKSLQVLTVSLLENTRLERELDYVGVAKNWISTIANRVVDPLHDVLASIIEAQTRGFATQKS
jgi:hypothetical protein